MKWIGALLIVAGCGSSGFLLAGAYRREERMLQQLTDSIGWMLCELRCRGTDLPELYRRAGERAEGAVGRLFDTMARELSRRVEPDVLSCMQIVLNGNNLPAKVRQILLLLGKSMGEFHLDGQLQQLQAVHGQCIGVLEEHRRNRDSRVRTYQTLGLSSGLTLAILLL